MKSNCMGYLELTLGFCEVNLSFFLLFILNSTIGKIFHGYTYDLQR